MISPGQGIGPIKIGMSIDAVKFALGPTELMTLHLPHNEDIALGAWRTASKVSVFVFFRTTFPVTYGKVIVVGIDGDATYTTNEGVHIGSNIEEVRAAFGDPPATKHAERLEYSERGIVLTIKQNRVARIFVCQSADDCGWAF